MTQENRFTWEPRINTAGNETLEQKRIAVEDPEPDDDDDDSEDSLDKLEREMEEEEGKDD